MQSRPWMMWRSAVAIVGMGVATFLAIPTASADLLPDLNSKWLDRRFLVLRAERFDPYCEHRRKIEKGDTFESIAKSVYGDAKRANEIATKNPKLETERLPVGEWVVLPPKEAPPRDATETLAWEFWIYCRLSGYMELQRVYPDESLAIEGKYPRLIAIPAEHHDELAKAVEVAKSAPPERPGRPVFVNSEAIVRASPWAIPAKDLYVGSSVRASTGAVESTTTVRVVEIVATTDKPGRFVVKEESVEYRDRVGNVVMAGIDVLFTWRGIPLGLIALLGFMGLRRMRRARRAAATVLGVGIAMLLTAPSASADIIEPGYKRIEVRLRLHAGRFDDYCEHRRVIEKGDTFDAYAKQAYGDAARAKEIAAANPKLEATHLPVGEKVILPPKLTPPADAKEALAWTFWGHASRSDAFALQRIFPDETFGPQSVFGGLFAVPADKVADLEKLLEAAKPNDSKSDGSWVYEVLKRAPWAIPVNGLPFGNLVTENSPANQSVTTFLITDLAASPNPPGRFVVKKESVEYRDRKGNVVKAGFDLLFTWRGIPLGLIALVGAIGLARMRRARGGAATVLGVGIAMLLAAPSASADVLPGKNVQWLGKRYLVLKASKETLAWEFWVSCSISGNMPLQRVYPDESIWIDGKFPELVAFPAERHDEFAKLLDAAKARNPKAYGLWPEEIRRQAPWVILATGLHVNSTVDSSSSAVESTTLVRIVELVPTTDKPARFVVETKDTEYRDRTGNVVVAGLDLLFSWRGIPLGLIALIGAIGLQRMRRARGGAAAS